MSLSSRLKNAKSKKKSLIPYLEKAIVKKPEKFSIRSIRSAIKKLQDLVDKETPFEDIREEFFFSLFGLLNAAYAPRKRSTAGIHLSSFEHECLRKLYYNFNGTAPSDKHSVFIKPSLQVIFDQGTWFHTYIQNHLYSEGILLKAEAPVFDEEEKVDSSTDGVCRFPDDPELYLLEIKTMNGFQFQKLSKPVDKHVFQASNYADILNIKQVIYLYINKDTCDFKEYILPVDKDSVSRRKAKSDKLHKSLLERKIPVRSCATRYDKEAKECVFCTHCFTKE